jgi:hypothetical protein
MTYLPVAKEAGSTETIAETKENLSAIRTYEAQSNFMKGNTVYTELEKTYGKYLYLPFDIPVIVPHDIEKFKSWFYAHGKNAGKQIEDFSSGTFEATPKTYVSIDSVSPGWTPVWSLNASPDVYTEFPELFEQIHDYMPWVGNKDFRWNMWSSSNKVPAHRDHTSCVDAPLAMRIKLYDNNPSETLSLLVDPIKEHNNQYKYLPKLSDTNSFTWNNLRTKHKSIFLGRPYRKILFIWRDTLRTDLQVNQFVDLLDRSISKYESNKDLVWVDDNLESDYLPSELTDQS